MQMKKIINSLLMLAIIIITSIIIFTPAAGDSAMTKPECISKGGTPGEWVAGPPTGVDGAIYKCTFPNDSACQGVIIRVHCDDKGSGIYAIINIAVNILTAGVGIAATAGLIFAGFRYSQARDSAENVAGAKKMITNIIIGLVIWAVFFTLIKWLLPTD